MTDFKLGDSAWYFTFPEDGCGGFDINEIDFHKSHPLSQTDIDHGGYLEFAYKTKEDALESILKRINRIREIS